MNFIKTTLATLMNVINEINKYRKGQSQIRGKSQIRHSDLLYFTKKAFDNVDHEKWLGLRDRDNHFSLF